MNLAFIDVETTGLDPNRHMMWEVALLVLGAEPGLEAVREWQLPVNLANASPDALRVNNFYKRYVGPPAKPNYDIWGPDTEGEFARDFINLTADRHLVGMNPAFDVSFLKPRIEQQGLVPMWHYHLIDVEPMMMQHLIDKGEKVDIPWKSTDLSQRVGVDPDRFDRHTAMGDAQWAMTVYYTLMGEHA